MQIKTLHKWIGTNEIYVPNKLNPDMYNPPKMCVYTCVRGKHNGIHMVSSCHISMLAHYDRIARKNGYTTIWHYGKPYWVVSQVC